MNCQPGRLGRCQNEAKVVSQPIGDNVPPTSEETDSPKSVSGVRVSADASTDVDIEADEMKVSDLPPYSLATSPNFMWGRIDGESFTHTISCCHAEIVHWKRNLFKVPSGKAGSAFTGELARLFRAYGESSAMELVSLNAAMVLPSLMLQKPHPKSKAKDHISHLSRCLELWAKGDVDALMAECRTIQHQLTGGAHTNTPNLRAKQHAPLRN